MAIWVLTTHDLRKSFTFKQKTVQAVDGVDLEVRGGDIFGFLGPNGAGKTTTLRMLTTLLAIDGGEAAVAGIDVRKSPHEVRKRIGYVSQIGGADDEATGREDLMLQGRLYGMSRRDTSSRARDLIVMLAMDDFADRKISTYSGGQKRRLDVASGIMHQPAVLFLDEPTTGLDPQNRANLWDQVRRLRDLGTTIFLTTNYLEEADALCDHLAIIDHGKIVAQGSPQSLKSEIAGDSITLTPANADGGLTDELRRVVADQPFVREVAIERGEVRLYVENGTATLPKIFTLLESKGIQLESVSLSQPSLDDVFLKQTGRSLRDATIGAGDRA
jgi:ABC-2 type transport system ATP-binding protein